MRFWIFAIILAAATGASAHQREAGEKVSIETLVADLNSPDGQKRIAASAEIFRRGKAVLPDLKKVGAKQVTPFGTILSSRLNAVYSLIEGLPANPVDKLAGYSTSRIGLILEKGTTKEEVIQMGKKYGFSLGNFRGDTVPNCYVTLDKGKSLADVMQQVLKTEPKLISVHLHYFER